MANVSDLGAGPVFRLETVKDVLLESGSRNYEHLDFLIVGNHPQYPKKRSLIQFEDLQKSKHLNIKWAKMYLYFWYAHKASWHTVKQTPYISCMLQVHQVKKHWREDEATSTFRAPSKTWSEPYLALDGTDAVQESLCAVPIHTSRPSGFVEFDVTAAVENWDRGEPNHGLLIWATNENEEGRDLRFYDRKRENEVRPFINVLCEKKPTSTSTALEAELLQLQLSVRPENKNEKPESKNDPWDNRISIAGARKIWNTMRFTTVHAVKNAIESLTDVPTKELTIKRKFREAQDSKKVVKWWFIVKGEEAILVSLEDVWRRIELQTEWKLIPLMKYPETIEDPSQNVPVTPGQP